MDNKPRESVTTVNLDGADHVASPVGRRRSTLRQALSQGLKPASEYIAFEQIPTVLEEAGDSLLPVGKPQDFAHELDADPDELVPEVAYMGKSYKTSWKRKFQSYLPRAPPEADIKPKRVYWIDLMRIIACLGVPIVHAINYAGKAGSPVRWDPNYSYCGWSLTSPDQEFAMPESTQKPQNMISFYMERRYMAGFTLFFFASGAALYMSSYFIKNPVKFGFSRFVYLFLMIIVGVLTCLVPANAIFYGAKTFNELFIHFNMLQHLGFLVTLIVFTVMHIPVAIAMRRRSVNAYIIWIVFFAFLIAFGIFIIVDGKMIHRDVGIMLLLAIAVIMWIVVSSLFTPLIYFRGLVATVGHMLVYSVPTHMDEIWGEREGGASNMISTVILVGCLYWIPFTLAMYVCAFKPPPNKYYDAANLLGVVFCFTLFMEWSIPMYEDGWREAYSIRTYNDRFERSMYILNMYWTIWFLYTLFMNFDGEPFKKYIAISNTFVLVLYIWHPLFLSIAECYLVVPIGQNIGLVPHLVEIYIMYFVAMVGCALVHAAIVYSKKGIGLLKKRRAHKQTMLSDENYHLDLPMTADAGTAKSGPS